MVNKWVKNDHKNEMSSQHQSSHASPMTLKLGVKKNQSAKKYFGVKNRMNRIEYFGVKS